MAEVYSVQLPDGRVIQKELPDGATDGQIRKAFAKDMHGAGINVMRQRIQRPSNEDHWREKLGDQGQLSESDLSIGETLEGSLGDLLAKALSERNARRIAGKAFNFVNDATPVGNITGAEEGGQQFYRGLTQGDLGQMALGAGSFALSVLPGAQVAKREGMDMLRALMADESGAIRAWHGSPHDFDRFDMSKIGTGEGAQAYGHGLYFAENPNVAKQYREGLAGPTQWQPVKPGEAYDRVGAYLSDNHGWAAAIRKADDLFRRERQTVDEILEVAPNEKDVLDWGARIDQALADLQSIQPDHFTQQQPGRLYEVNINAEPEDFLDWDAPIAEQPNAMKALENLDLSHMSPGLRTRVLLEKARQGAEQAHYPATGRELLNAISDYGESRNGDLMALQPYGIKGVRYLDQGSRGAAQGTRNFVVPDASLIDILNKY